MIRRRETMKSMPWVVNPLGVNLIDMDKREDGWEISGNNPPSLAPYIGWSTSDYIRVNPGETYRIEWVNMNRGGWGKAVYYGKEKNYVGGLRGTTYNAPAYEFTVPEDVYYVRIGLGEIAKIQAGGYTTLVRIK